MQLIKKEVWVAVVQEWQETKEAWKIFITPPYGWGKTPSETKKLLTQVSDLIKIGVLGGIIALPFGCVFAVVVIKLASKCKIKLLPTAFSP